MGNGNVHSANGWRDVLGTVIARHAGRDQQHFFHADAAYITPALYARLEKVAYVSPIRLPANAVLR